MKNNLTQIANKAGLHKDWFIDNPEIQSFAMLIIEECARIAQNADLSDVEGGDSAVLRAAATEIRELKN